MSESVAVLVSCAARSSSSLGRMRARWWAAAATALAWLPVGARCKQVELQLMTGRTHQIRVHLSHLGHPIAGDSAYGGKSVSQRDLVLVKEAVGVGDHRAYVGGVHAEGTTVLSRQALHAT